MTPLLKTKLFAPPAHPNQVVRPRLAHRLDDGLALGRRLTLVTAPAGYGKTTLVSAWLHGTGRPLAWFSLDAGDNDLVRFLSYLVAACRKVAGPVGEGVLTLLNAPALPSVEALMTILVNDLAELEEPAALVLDDYHVIEAEPIHEAVQYLVDHQPPNVHLVITSRVDPPLPISRWRVRGQVTEVRVSDLRFTTDEADAFLNGMMALGLPANAVSSLGERTEGWIAGLQLAALSLQGADADRAAAFVEAFNGSHRYIIDYLAEEVLGQQSPELRDFLCQTGVLDRFCAPLCDAVTGRTDSKAVLAALDRLNLFLIPLDEHRQWYRYHHLFADVLRSELTREQQAPQHLRAAAWYEESGHLIEAVGHASAAASWSEAARLITKAAPQILLGGEARTMLAWVDSVPEETVRACPELMVYRAWSLYMTSQLGAAVAYVDGMDPGQVAGLAPRVRGGLRCLQAWLTGMQGKSETIPLAYEALELVGPEPSLFRVALLLMLSNVDAMQGRPQKSVEVLYEVYEMGRTLGYPMATLAAAMNLGLTLTNLGRRREGEALCREAVSAFSDAQGRPLPLAGMVLVSLGYVLLEAGQLDEAEQCLLEGDRLVNQAGVKVYVAGDVEVWLGTIAMIRGEVEAALAQVRRGAESAVRLGRPRVASYMEAMEALIQAQIGDPAAAVRWLESCGLTPDMPPSIWSQAPQLIYARVLLATGRLDDAATVMDRLEQLLRQEGRLGTMVSLHVMQALLAAARGQGEAAGRCLETAVSLAAGEEYVTPFLEGTPRLLKLLPAVRHVAPAFVDHLLGVGSRSPVGAPVASAAGAGAVAASVHQAGLVEPLSERELELLRLLAAGLSNQEIADKLFIGLSTAKWHVVNILGKLGVKNRTQAVARARELNLV